MQYDNVLTVKVSTGLKNRVIEAARMNKRSSYSDWARFVLEYACRASESPQGVISSVLSAEDMEIVQRAALLDHRDLAAWAEVTLVSRARRIVEDAERRGVKTPDAV